MEEEDYWWNKKLKTIENYKVSRNYTCIGNMPGIIGTVIPISRQSRINFSKTSTSKNNCVITKFAPASIFDLR